MMSLYLPSSVISPPKYSYRVHCFPSAPMLAIGIKSIDWLTSLSKGGLTLTITLKFYVVVGVGLIVCIAVRDVDDCTLSLSTLLA